LVRKYAHLEVRRPTIWVKILVQFGITSWSNPCYLHLKTMGYLW
jgi:hypothetical protein